MKTKKEKIFDAIFETIYEEGNIANIRVSDIAKRAGIGKGTVYMYFASKEQMIFESTKYLIDSTMKSIIDFEPDTSSFEVAFKGFIGEHIKVTKKYSSMLNATSTTDYFPQLTPEFRKMMTDVVENIKAQYRKSLDKYVEIGARENIISHNHNDFELIAVAHMLFSTSGDFNQNQISSITDDADRYIDMQYNMAVKMLK